MTTCIIVDEIRLIVFTAYIIVHVILGWVIGTIIYFYFLREY